MATELATKQAELTAVRAAMTTITEGGQSVSVGDITYTEASYGALSAREKHLSGQIARRNGSRPRILPVNFGSFNR